MISERGMSNSAKTIHLVEIYQPVSGGLCEPDFRMWVGIPGQPEVINRFRTPPSPIHFCRPANEKRYSAPGQILEPTPLDQLRLSAPPHLLRGRPQGTHIRPGKIRARLNNLALYISTASFFVHSSPRNAPPPFSFVSCWGTNTIAKLHISATAYSPGHPTRVCHWGDVLLFSLPPSLGLASPGKRPGLL